MRIAIHHRDHSFSEQWITYCDANNINYKLVDAYSTDFIEDVRGCDIFMWHHNHTTYQDNLAAKNILFTLQQIGIKTYPDFNTGWHFDDKVAQKYLLEAIGAPLVPSYVFYEKENAIRWIEKTSFPKVFKLTGGSGAHNVKLVRSKRHAIQLTNQAFSSGFSQFDRMRHFKERLRRFKEGKDNLTGVLKGLYRFFVLPPFSKMSKKEKGYVYFQDFMPDNMYDIRLIVIGNKAYGMKRGVREGDFRASGSGKYIYDEIPHDVIKIGFDVADRLKMQSVAFDFIYDESQNPVIVEMSYGFGTTGSSQCKGYWDSSLIWHEGSFNPQVWMIENLIADLKQK